MKILFWSISPPPSPQRKNLCIPSYLGQFPVDSIQKSMRRYLPWNLVTSCFSCSKSVEYVFILGCQIIARYKRICSFRYYENITLINFTSPLPSKKKSLHTFLLGTISGWLDSEINATLSSLKLRTPCFGCSKSVEYVFILGCQIIARYKDFVRFGIMKVILWSIYLPPLLKEKIFAYLPTWHLFPVDSIQKSMQRYPPWNLATPCFGCSKSVEYVFILGCQIIARYKDFVRFGIMKIILWSISLPPSPQRKNFCIPSYLGLFSCWLDSESNATLSSLKLSDVMLQLF